MSLGNHLLMAWSLRVTGQSIHFCCCCDCCVSQDNSSFDGMVVACHRMINASMCHRAICLLMAWSLCVIGRWTHFFSFSFLFLFAIVACRRAIRLLICDCCISQGNSSFDLRLLHFTGQFIFWIAIAAFLRAICVLILWLLRFTRQFFFWFAIAAFHRAICLLILRLLRFTGQFVF